MKVMLSIGFLLLLQPVFPQYNWSVLDKKLEEKRQVLGNNVVCLISNKDSLLFKKEMGGFNATTVAPIASCSKWLTAALVMQFVDEGKLKVSDKVSKYIPAFAQKGKEELCILNTLCHMTGIESAEGGFLQNIMERRKYKTLEQEVNGFAARNQRAKSGTDFWYSSIGLNTAGRVIEIISGKKFEDVIKEKLFDPLEMNNTSFAAKRGGGPVNPSGGASSTAEDYMKFLNMLLNKGLYKGKRILSENAIEQMKGVQDNPGQIKYAPKAAEGYMYALGSWVVEDSTKTITLEADRPLYKPGDNPVPGVDYIQKKMATALASPGLFGTWPMVDFCRGYTYIVFVKNLLGEQRAGIHKELKKIIDEQISSRCK